MSNKPSTIYPNGIKPQIGDVTTSKAVGRGTRALRSYTLLQTRVKRLEEQLEQMQSRLVLLEAENARLEILVTQDRYGNPEVAEVKTSGNCRDFTLPILPKTMQDKEKVHPQRKL